MENFFSYMVQRRRKIDFTYNRYMVKRAEARIRLSELGVQFAPKVLWWPTPKQYFQSHRKAGAHFFKYTGDNQEIARLNERLKIAWNRYLMYAGH
jgi:hypothetical protein